MQLSMTIIRIIMVLSLIVGLGFSVISCILSYAIQPYFFSFDFMSFVVIVVVLALIFVAIGYIFYFIGRKTNKEDLAKFGVYVMITVCFITILSILWRISLGMMISYWITVHPDTSFIDFLKSYITNFFLVIFKNIHLIMLYIILSNMSNNNCYVCATNGSGTRKNVHTFPDVIYSQEQKII